MISPSPKHPEYLDSWTVQVNRIPFGNHQLWCLPVLPPPGQRVLPIYQPFRRCNLVEVSPLGPSLERRNDVELYVGVIVAVVIILMLVPGNQAVAVILGSVADNCSQVTIYKLRWISWVIWKTYINKVLPIATFRIGTVYNTEKKNGLIDQVPKRISQSCRHKILNHENCELKTITPYHLLYTTFSGYFIESIQKSWWKFPSHAPLCIDQRH